LYKEKEERWGRGAGGVGLEGNRRPDKTRQEDTKTNTNKTKTKTIKKKKHPMKIG
jgi:hypothetical protein